MTGPPRKVRAPDLTLMKARGERIVMLTAYDATMARLPARPQDAEAAAREAQRRPAGVTLVALSGSRPDGRIWSWRAKLGVRTEVV